MGTMKLLRVDSEQKTFSEDIPLRHEAGNDATELALFVRTSQETIAHWDRTRIIDALVRETYIDVDTADIREPGV